MIIISEGRKRRWRLCRLHLVLISRNHQISLASKEVFFLDLEMRVDRYESEMFFLPGRETWQVVCVAEELLPGSFLFFNLSSKLTWNSHLLFHWYRSHLSVEEMGSSCERGIFSPCNLKEKWEESVSLFGSLWRRKNERWRKKATSKGTRCNFCL